MPKSKQITWIILAIIFLIVSLGVITIIFTNELGYEKVMRSRLKDDAETIAAEPVEEGLFYSSKMFAGLCRGKNGEDAGCYFELYLYRDGRFNKKVGFVYYEDRRRENEPTIEKQFDQKFIDSIIKKLTDANLQVKNCIPQRIMDAGWDYEINLTGRPVLFRDPPEQCKAVFEEINKLLDPQ